MQRYKYFLVIAILGIGISIPKFPLTDSTSIVSATPRPSSTSANDLELLPIIQSLLSENLECQLPCFWSFEPGRTTMEEVEIFIHNALGRDLTVGQRVSSDGVLNRSLILSFGNDAPIQGIALNFTFENETLSRLHIDLSYPEEWLLENRFDLSNLLSQMKSFSEIYVGINTSTGSISLNVVDQDNEIMVRYSLLLKVQGNILSPDVDRPLLFCPTPDLNFSISLWLQNPNADEPFDLLTSNPTLSNSSVAFYQPIDWMSGLEPSEFVERILDEPNKCIELLSYPELIERGYGF